MKIPQLGDFLTAINYTKTPLLDNAEPEVEKAYPAYIARRLMSYHMDTVLPAAYMNQYHELPSKIQFDFLRESTSKRRRFSKFAKEEKSRLDNIKLISDAYDVSHAKARELLPICTEDDLEELRSRQTTGGRNKK